MDWIETAVGDGDSGFYVATAGSRETRLDSKSCIPCKKYINIETSMILA